MAPGSTPVRPRRRRDSSQSSQIASQRAKRGESEPLTLEIYARELIKGELTQRLFALTQKIHKKLPEHVSEVNRSSLVIISIQHCLSPLSLEPLTRTLSFPCTLARTSG